MIADSDSYSDDQIMNNSASTSNHGRPQMSLGGDKVIESSSAMKVNKSACLKPVRVPIRDSNDEYLERNLDNSSEDSSLSKRQGDSNLQISSNIHNNNVVSSDKIEGVRDSLGFNNESDGTRAMQKSSASQNHNENSVACKQYNQLITASLTAVNRQHHQQQQTSATPSNNPPTTPQPSQNQASNFSNRHQNLLAKRLHHSRQNHGIAVAPPQLPPYTASDSLNAKSPIIPTSVNKQQRYNPHLVSQDISSSVDEDTLNSEYDQSPIAQRQLKRVIEHKGTASQSIVSLWLFPTKTSLHYI